MSKPLVRSQSFLSRMLLSTPASACDICLGRAAWLCKYTLYTFHCHIVRSCCKLATFCNAESVFQWIAMIWSMLCSVLWKVLSTVTLFDYKVSGSISLIKNEVCRIRRPSSLSQIFLRHSEVIVNLANCANRPKVLCDSTWSFEFLEAIACLRFVILTVTGEYRITLGINVWVDQSWVMTLEV
jgi:hypothetical protein